MEEAISEASLEAARTLRVVEDRLKQEELARKHADMQVEALNAQVELLTAQITWKASEWRHEHRKNATLRAKIEQVRSTQGPIGDFLREENKRMELEVEQYTGMLLDLYANCAENNLPRFHRLAASAVKDYKELSVLGDRIEWLLNAIDFAPNALQKENRILKHKLTSQRELMELIARMPEDDLPGVQGEVKESLNKFPWYESRFDQSASKSEE